MRATFYKAGRKMIMRTVPNEGFGAWEFLDRKIVKIIFWGRGPPKSTILGFSGIDGRNFCEVGKNVFLRPRFFRKIEEMGG